MATATGRVPVGAVGKSAPARFARVAGSIASDDRRVEPGDHARGGEVSGGTAPDDPSGSRPTDRTGVRPDHRQPVDVGAIYRASPTTSVAATSDQPCLEVTSESCLRNPLQEIRTVGSVREELSWGAMVLPKRARSWKRRIQPRNTYSPSGSPLLGETGFCASHVFRIKQVAHNHL
jgi:hypothetical protein